ncbi:unnamed protein product [Brassicogethes aeneus]|uniref:UDP-glucuronosyltransferase n=1 Tax=Brassicogethes aeneus TaxID=1431903 RepID=A0A9P0ATI5_BRAAE|nr:unnamed protein product [Brassicogethes aeneus]
MLFKLLIFALTASKINSARILCVMPLPFYSHQTTFQPIWKELSLRGHNVTTIVTDGINDETLTNLTEIVVKESHESLKRHNFLHKHAESGFFGFVQELEYFVEDLYNVQFGDQRVKSLMNDPNAKFDLVIFEAATYPMIYAWKFKCPSIGVLSMQAPIYYNDAMGNPTHPLVSPEFLLEIDDVDNMTLMEKVVSILTYIIGHIMRHQCFQMYDEINQKYFGDGIPRTEKLIKDMDMLFVVDSPIINNLRPVYPHTISLGSGLHIKPKKALSKDLKNYLDHTKKPVVYFSLGTIVKANLLNQTSKLAIYEAFSELPYKFLVKADWENVTVPENVKVAKWLPQQDILRHPNIKLFITQGGLQSLQEAVTNGIPLVGIPFFCDQYQNVQKIVKRGFAVKISRYQITKEAVKNAITEVLNNPKYKEKVKEMRDFMYDEPMTSLDKAIWWIEYVLRHKGAPLFKSKATKMPMYEYLMLDVIAAVLLFSIICSFCIWMLIQLVFRMVKFMLFGEKVVKLKKN